MTDISSEGKEKSMPMRLFIRDLAPCFTALFRQARKRHYNQRVRWGGRFPDFVRAVARQWKIKPPSVEAVAQAIRPVGQALRSD